MIHALKNMFHAIDRFFRGIAATMIKMKLNHAGNEGDCAK